MHAEQSDAVNAAKFFKEFTRMSAFPGEIRPWHGREAFFIPDPAAPGDRCKDLIVSYSDNTLRGHEAFKRALREFGMDPEDVDRFPHDLEETTKRVREEHPVQGVVDLLAPVPPGTRGLAADFDKHDVALTICLRSSERRPSESSTIIYKPKARTSFIESVRQEILRVYLLCFNPSAERVILMPAA